jgi:hypothetical protein
MIQILYKRWQIMYKRRLIMGKFLQARAYIGTVQNRILEHKIVQNVIGFFLKMFVKPSKKVEPAPGKQFRNLENN